MNDSSAKQFVVCLHNDGAEDLDVRKLYEVVSDGAANARGLTRVIDESGQSYLYPQEWFAFVEVSREVGLALASVEMGRGLAGC